MRNRHRRLRPPYLASLGVVLSASTAAAMALAAPAPPTLALAADPGPCGATGVLTGSTTLVCTYTTVGSDTFTVPAGMTSFDIDVVGAHGGHYFIAGDAAHPPPAGDITGRPGGKGGEAAGTLTSLTAGNVLQVGVAGMGANGTAASRSGGMMNGPSGGQGALGGFGGSNGGVVGGPGDAGGANGGTAFNGGNGSGAGGSSDVRIATGGCAALTCGLSALSWALSTVVVVLTAAGCSAAPPASAVTTTCGPPHTSQLASGPSTATATGCTALDSPPRAHTP